MNTQAPSWDTNNIIASIYKAAMEPELWPSVLSNMSCLLRFAQVSLLFLDHCQQRIIVITSTSTYNNNTDEDIHTYKLLHSILLTSPLGECALIDKELASQFRAPPSTQVLSFTPPKLLTPLFSTSANSAALLINFDDQRPLSSNGHVVIEQLSRHIVKALHVHNHLNKLKHRNDSIKEVLEHTSTPIFVLNTDLQVIFHNREAEQLLARQQALRLNPKGYLQVFSAKEKNSFTKILKKILMKDSHLNYCYEEIISLAISHPDKKHPIRLCFLPIQKPDYQQPKNPFITIFAYDPEQPRHIAPEYLKQAFNLTPAEIHITQLLASGFTIAEIAKIRHTTLESTRWQMKQVLQKTNTHSQSELMRMLVILGQSFNGSSLHLQ